MAPSSDRPSASHQYSLNCVFFRRLAALVPVLLPIGTSPATLLFLLLLALAAIEQCVVYWVGLIPSRYFKVLGDKDLTAFKWLTLQSLALVILVALVKSLCLFVGSVLYINWRKLLTNRLHQLYFANTAFYKINVLQNSIDNPDQRITQDVNKLCEKLSAIVPTVFIVPFIIAYYTYTVYENTGYIGVVGIYGFFMVASCMNRVFMSPIVRYVVEQERCEGDFRFQHMQVRVHAESLAFSSPAAAAREAAESSLQLEQLVRAQLKQASRRLLLGCAVSAVDYLGSIGNYLVIAGPIFAGWYDHLSPQQLSQVISKNSFVCMYLIFSFTRLVNLTSDVADIAGVTHRIGELIESLTSQNDVIKRDDDVIQTGKDVTQTGNHVTRRDSDGFGSKVVSSTSRDRLISDVCRNAGRNVFDGASSCSTLDTDCILCNDKVERGVNNEIDQRSLGVIVDGEFPTNGVVLECLTTVSDFEWLEECPEHGSITQDVSSDDWTVPYTLHRVSLSHPSFQHHSTPSPPPLISELCLRIRRGHSLLISGASGSGKTALLRLLRGLWHPLGGCVTRHVHWHELCTRWRCHVMFVPQRAFFGSGSLLQQVVYPGQTGGACVDVDRVDHVLSLTRLDNIREQCGGLDGTPPNGNWNDVLSPGEMQRLCFARVLYRRPWFVFLDETTSALEPQLSCLLYRACVRAGITLISVAHGDLLVPFHRWRLHLNLGGSWRLDQLPH